MRKAIFLILIFTFLIYGQKRVICYTELDNSETNNINRTYNEKLRELVGADAQTSLVSHAIIERMKHNSPIGEIGIDTVTENYLKRYGLDSVIVIVPTLEKFDIYAGRAKGIRGAVMADIYGSLYIRFNFYDLDKKENLKTVVVKADTSNSLELTMLQPVRKGSNISIEDREEMISDLINISVRKFYREISSFFATLDSEQIEKNIDENKDLKE